MKLELPELTHTRFIHTVGICPYCSRNGKRVFLSFDTERLIFSDGKPCEHLVAFASSPAQPARLNDEADSSDSGIYQHALWRKFAPDWNKYLSALAANQVRDEYLPRSSVRTVRSELTLIPHDPDSDTDASEFLTWTIFSEEPERFIREVLELAKQEYRLPIPKKGIEFDKKARENEPKGHKPPPVDTEKLLPDESLLYSLTGCPFCDQNTTTLISDGQTLSLYANGSKVVQPCRHLVCCDNWLYEPEYNLICFALHQPVIWQEFEDFEERYDNLLQPDTRFKSDPREPVLKVHSFTKNIDLRDQRREFDVELECRAYFAMDAFNFIDMIIGKDRDEPTEGDEEWWENMP